MVETLNYFDQREERLHRREHKRNANDLRHYHTRSPIRHNDCDYYCTTTLKKIRACHSNDLSEVATALGFFRFFGAAWCGSISNHLTSATVRMLTVLHGIYGTDGIGPPRYGTDDKDSSRSV